MSYEETCPDCGELLVNKTGILPLTTVLYCLSCNWCEEFDSDRQDSPESDYIRRYCN